MQYFYAIHLFIRSFIHSFMSSLSVAVFSLPAELSSLCFTLSDCCLLCECENDCWQILL